MTAAHLHDNLIIINTNTISSCGHRHGRATGCRALLQHGRVASTPFLLRSLQTMGFTTMTPVQHKVLTQLPAYTSDCLVQAKTGTGKTVAFLLPALHSLLAGPPLPRGQVAILVISPTRELASQIAKGSQRPGRLKDYLSDPDVAAKLQNIRTVILDEADTMLEKGFLSDVKSILHLLPPKAQAGWQGMCFSATVPAKVLDVINVVLRPGYTSISTVDKLEPPTLERVPQYHVYMPDVVDTFTTLAALLEFETRSDSKIIVFGITANVVALLAKLFSDLSPQNLKVYELHSRLSQNIRTRTTEEFKAAATGIMFASDVIGRGMDFPNVDLVIQVGLPANAEQYVHRVGRTARAGSDGRAVILLTQSESFFVNQNRKLPIQPHPDGSIDCNSERAASRASGVEHAQD
ncbi:hypothetical protein MRB53_040378 [Persea americana]|nr:hypothetical protein MRB53_040378 [Persea americana]